LATDERNIVDWVYTHLEGRFYFGDKMVINPDGRRDMCKVIAFERHSEATYFGLFVDQLNQPNVIIW
jgi:hypothetical protein